MGLQTIINNMNGLLFYLSYLRVIIFKFHSLYPHTRISSLQDSSVWLKKIECRTHFCYQFHSLIFWSKHVLEIVFCCYNCLDLRWEKFFQVWVPFFPSSLKKEQCFEKVTNSYPSASNLHNLFSTLLSCSEELAKQVTHTWKNFFHRKSRQL